MEKKKISFVSTRSRGLTPDLKIVKDYLSKNMEHVEFSYLTINENSDNFMVQRGAKNAKKEYCRTIEDTICVDGSIPIKLAGTAGKGKKILISVPYDYQFKAMSEVSNAKKGTFKSFTHVISGSRFGEELFERKYKHPNGVIIKDLVSPFAWDINQESRIKEKREKFERHFPSMRGKKILSIMITGLREEEEPNPYAGFDWESLFEQLGDDWFVFTNSEDALESAINLNSEYIDKFGFIQKMLDNRDLLYFSDCIVTNSGMYASYFSSKKKPLYCVNYKGNGFERYMKKNYSSMYIESLDQITKLPIAGQEYNGENKRFAEYFSYGLKENPCKVILDLLTEEIQ